MVHLTLVGLSKDHTRLLLVNDAGEEFTLDADATLRSALRGVDPRPGQLEIRMDSALRPRDIQARIRAGETPESVAQAAQSTVEKIMTYAAPVLAERAHVAERAQKSSVRRRSGDGASSLGGGRTLGDVVAHHLRAANVDPGTVEWDAWRREDGRWTLTGTFATPARKGTATFTFDMPGNYVTVEDDDARWLVGEATSRPARPPSPAAGGSPEGSPRRRLSAVRAEELPLGEDAIELVTEAPVEAYLEEQDPAASSAGVADEHGDEPSHAPSHEPGDRRQRAAEERSDGHDEPQGDDAPTQEQPAARQDEVARRPVKKNRGRASVPSWDEIMFGGGTGD